MTKKWSLCLKYLLLLQAIIGHVSLAQQVEMLVCQSGPDILITWSGSLSDLSGLTTDPSFPPNGVQTYAVPFSTSNYFFIVGGTNQRYIVPMTLAVFNGGAGWNSFGTASGNLPDSTPSDIASPLALGNGPANNQNNGEGLFSVPVGYMAGDPIEGSATIDGNTFAGLGFANGVTNTLSWTPPDTMVEQSITVTLDENCASEAPSVAPSVTQSEVPSAMPTTIEQCLQGPQVSCTLGSTGKSKGRNKPSKSSVPSNGEEGIQLCIYNPGRDASTSKSKGKTASKSKSNMTGKSRRDRTLRARGNGKGKNGQAPFFETRCVNADSPLDSLEDQEELVQCGCCAFFAPNLNEDVCAARFTVLPQ